MSESDKMITVSVKVGERWRLLRDKQDNLEMFRTEEEALRRLSEQLEFWDVEAVGIRLYDLVTFETTKYAAIDRRG